MPRSNESYAGTPSSAARAVREAAPPLTTPVTWKPSIEW